MHYFPQHARGFIRGFIIRSIIIATIYEGKIKAQFIGQFFDQIHTIAFVLTIALQLLVRLHQLSIWFVLQGLIAS